MLKPRIGARGFGGWHALTMSPRQLKGGDPSGTYKRWFGRVSGRGGWWRGSSLVSTSYWPGCRRGKRAGFCHARDRVQRMDAWLHVLAENLAPRVTMLQQGWRSLHGLRHFLLSGLPGPVPVLQSPNPTAYARESHNALPVLCHSRAFAGLKAAPFSHSRQRV
jgi:hypothetical protein